MNKQKCIWEVELIWENGRYTFPVVSIPEGTREAQKFIYINTSGKFLSFTIHRKLEVPKIPKEYRG